ncbi:MAG: hypothetical protein ACFFBD_30050 [Candidatus Hodarchaeota archaeon]
MDSTLRITYRTLTSMKGVLNNQLTRTDYQEALDLAEQLGEHKGKAIILSTLGVVLYSQKDKKEA